MLILYCIISVGSICSFKSEARRSEWKKDVITEAETKKIHPEDGGWGHKLKNASGL